MAKVFRMRRHDAFLAAILLVPSMALLTVGTAQAVAPQGRSALTVIPDREAEPSALVAGWRVGQDSGIPRALYRVGHQVDPADPETMASQYLRENATELRLSRSDLSDLEHHATWTGPAGSTVRLRQHVDGVPVYHAELAITVDRDARVVFVMNGYRPNASTVETTPTVSRRQARETAIGYLGMKGGSSFERVRLIVYASAGETRLAWQTRVIPTQSPRGDWEVLVDASGGEVFRAEDIAAYVDGAGDTFDPDPLSTTGASYGDPGFVDGGDADTTELSLAREIRTLPNISFDGVDYTLVGPFAAIVDSDAPFKGTFAQTVPAFTFTRMEDGFEAVNAYYHIDHMMDYLNNTLGIEVMPTQYSGGVQYDPHGFTADQSDYSPSTGRLRFGEGYVDDAEDADVVIHELGHGLHDWITAGSGVSQVEGLSEGIGDFVAASYSRSLSHWTPADPQFHWVFNWDGHNTFWDGRVTNYAGRYPDDLVGNNHEDGQIWSTCMMKIWDHLGRDRTELVHWSGIAMTSTISSQEDAAQAVALAAVLLNYPVGQVQAIAVILRSCGYSPVVPFTGSIPLIPPSGLIAAGMLLAGLGAGALRSRRPRRVF